MWYHSARATPSKAGGGLYFAPSLPYTKGTDVSTTRVDTGSAPVIGFLLRSEAAGRGGAPEFSYRHSTLSFQVLLFRSWPVLTLSLCEKLGMKEELLLVYFLSVLLYCVVRY